MVAAYRHRLQVTEIDFNFTFTVGCSSYSLCVDLCMINFLFEIIWKMEVSWLQAPDTFILQNWIFFFYLESADQVLSGFPVLLL